MASTPPGVGAIIGIVVAIVVVSALGTVGICIYARSKRSARPATGKPPNLTVSGPAVPPPLFVPELGNSGAVHEAYGSGAIAPTELPADMSHARSPSGQVGLNSVVIGPDGMKPNETRGPVVELPGRTYSQTGWQQQGNIAEMGANNTQTGSDAARYQTGAESKR